MSCHQSPLKLLLPLLLNLLLFYPDGAAPFSSVRVRHRGARGIASWSHDPRPRGGLLAKGKGKTNDEAGDVVALIHSHHLLDHKPDNLVLSGRKFKLRGAACLGRPGAALCVGSPANVKKFARKLRGAMPQKKFGVVEVAEGASAGGAVAALDGVVDGFGRASLSELRELLTAVGREDVFLALVGIDASSQNGGRSRDDSNNNNSELKNDASAGGKVAGKKRKRKKRG